MHDLGDIAQQRVIYHHGSQGVAQCQQRLFGHDGLDVFQFCQACVGLMPLQDGLFFFKRGVPHHNLKHEAVKLCFGQFVGAFLLHRVLCGNNGVGFCHVVGNAVNAHLAFLHYLKESRLGLCRRTIDFVDEHHVGKNRAFMEVKFARFHVKHCSAEHVAGHQVGGELYATEPRINQPGRESGQQRLCHSRHTLKQHMAIGKYCRNQEVHNLIVSYHYSSDLFFYLPHLGRKLCQIEARCCCLFHCLICFVRC